MLNLFVSGEAMAAGNALAAAADSSPFARRAGINNFVILTTAFGATHIPTANCGSLLCTTLIIGASRRSKRMGNRNAWGSMSFAERFFWAVGGATLSKGSTRISEK